MQAPYENSRTVVWTQDIAPLELSTAVKGKDGVLRQRFRKAIMRKGTFYDAKTNRTFTVTDETLQHWEDTFKAMSANGNRVYVPMLHQVDNRLNIFPEEGASEPGGSGDYNRGWVKDIYKDGDRLMAIIDVHGEDGIKAVKRNDVSVYAPPKWTDGAGNEYEWPILHVALTPAPVIPGLGEFEPLAASQYFYREEKKSMDWTKIKTAFGIDKDLTDETAEQLLLSRAEQVDKTITELTDSLAEAQESLRKSEQALQLARTASPEVKTPDPTVLSLLKDNRTMKVDQLVTSGVLSTAAAKLIKDKHLTDESLSLSLARTDGGKNDGFDLMIEVLSANKPARLGERTGPQVIELSRQRGDGDEANILVKDAERRGKKA